MFELACRHLRAERLLMNWNWTSAGALFTLRPGLSRGLNLQVVVLRGVSFIINNISHQIQTQQYSYPIHALITVMSICQFAIYCTPRVVYLKYKVKTLHNFTCLITSTLLKLLLLFRVGSFS